MDETTPPDIKPDHSLNHFKNKHPRFFLYSFNKIPPVVFGISRKTIETLFPSSVTHLKQTPTQHFQLFINKDRTIKKNFINKGMTPDFGMYTASKKANKTFEKPESKNISCGSVNALEKPAFEKPNPTDLTLERSKPTELSFEKQNSADVRFQGPKSLETCGGSKAGNLSQGPPPEDVSWTRIDAAQARLDKVPLNHKVVMGIVSGMVATTVVHPLDVVKVRQQLFSKKIGTLTTLRRILACEGQKGLYTGLSAGLLRQLTYTGSRLYVYNKLVEGYRREHGRTPPLRARMYIAVQAGMVGAFVGTPSEVALVRIIETRRLRLSLCSQACPDACKRFPHHAGAFRELYSIACREGVKTWWRGGVATVIRSIFISSAQVGAYAEIRRAFKQRGHFVGGMNLHVCSAVCSSLISATLSLPVDQVKTRYQSFREKQNHVDILKHMLRQKGVMYLWKGFLPYYVRQTIHTVITYVMIDQLVDTYITVREGEPNK